MTILSGKAELIQHIAKTDPKKITEKQIGGDTSEHCIKGKVFSNYYFSGDFSSLKFVNCKFKECSFDRVHAFFFGLKKCKFSICYFGSSRFSHLEYEFQWDQVEFQECYFRLTQFDEGEFRNIFFLNSQLQGFNVFGIIPFVNIWFEDCTLDNAQFQSLISYEDDEEIDTEFRDLCVQNCDLEYCYFNTVDLRNSVLINTRVYKTAFIDCKFSRQSIVPPEQHKLPIYAAIDFQSILKSEEFDGDTLQKYFHITDPSLQSTVKAITSKINFKNVFISYSFKDKEFARALNQELKSRGVKTFLWEKDAPGGQWLDDIMAFNIRRHDKILFIASKNSLRSSACQFELSEGRKKQEATWENIFFPVHIDNYLFEVKKNQIRPIDKADEYWQNIEEIRRVNSVDFTNLVDYHRAPGAFKEVVIGIVRELKS